MIKFLREAYKMTIVCTVLVTACVVGKHAGDNIWKKVAKKIKEGDGE